jgi:ubiquinone/menaquinone biosynthesis C-methylase UbiE
MPSPHHARRRYRLRMVVRRDELIAAQYFLAVAGVAAMRKILLAPSEVMPRLEDARRVIEHLDEFPQNIRIPIVEYEVVEGYDGWAPIYDAGPNAATEVDSDVVRRLLEGLPAGRAVDVACGTGRQSRLLVELGHAVEGVDLNETMLAIARAAVPEAHFQQGTFDALPFDDGSFDLAVSSLALTHVADLRPALEEMARVVKPGGCAVLSDMHPEMVRLGVTAGFRTGDGATLAMAHVPNLQHEISAYVNGFVTTGWEICECVESTMPEEAIVGVPAYPVVPDAVRGAFEGVPFLLAWKLRRRG